MFAVGENVYFMCLCVCEWEGMRESSGRRSGVEWTPPSPEN